MKISPPNITTRLRYLALPVLVFQSLAGCSMNVGQFPSIPRHPSPLSFTTKATHQLAETATTQTASTEGRHDRENKQTPPRNQVTRTVKPK